MKPLKNAKFKVKKFHPFENRDAQFHVYFCNTYILGEDSERMANSRCKTLNKVLDRVRGKND